MTTLLLADHADNSKSTTKKKKRDGGADGRETSTRSNFIGRRRVEEVITVRMLIQNVQVTIPQHRRIATRQY